MRLTRIEIYCPDCPWRFERDVELPDLRDRDAVRQHNQRNRAFARQLLHDHIVKVHDATDPDGWLTAQGGYAYTGLVGPLRRRGEE